MQKGTLLHRLARPRNLLISNRPEPRKRVGQKEPPLCLSPRGEHPARRKSAAPEPRKGSSRRVRVHSLRLTRAEIHVNLDLLPQPVKDRHQPVHGEAVQLDPPDAGKVRRRNAGDLPGLANGQLALIEQLDNPGGKDRPKLFKIGVRMVEVAENIPAALDNIKIIVAHRSISFSRFSRSWIRSISAFGVLMPFLDFFWKACTTQTASPPPSRRA